MLMVSQSKTMHGSKQKRRNLIGSATLTRVSTIHRPGRMGAGAHFFFL
jgi:hypothetical protein